ncbi:hypothetical protein [Chryseobacterium indoltheticum]|jgi:hypothetical protein|nr:hypothetical protein [Chryseobacterium indoltheticum]MDF2832615.1 hypothetical protein [Chryseobacterium indoltheticum]
MEGIFWGSGDCRIVWRHIGSISEPVGTFQKPQPQVMQRDLNKKAHQFN